MDVTLPALLLLQRVRQADRSALAELEMLAAADSGGGGTHASIALCRALVDLGCSPRAVGLARETLAGLSANADAALLSLAQSALARALLAQGGIAEAADLAFSAESLAVDPMHPLAMHEALLAEAAVFAAAGDYREATMLAEGALAAARDTGPPIAVAECQVALASAAAAAAHESASTGSDDARGHAEQALRVVRSAVALTAGAGTPYWHAEASAAQVRTLLLVGDIGGAEQASAALRAHVAPLSVARLDRLAALCTAEVALVTGGHQAAVAAAAEALAEATRDADEACIGAAEALLAEALAQSGDLVRAQSALQACLATARKRRFGALGDLTRRLRDLVNERERARQELRVRRDEVVELKQAASELARRTEALIEAGQRDGLTDLASRARFDQVLPQLMEAARLALQPFALALIDIHRLKDINDTLGRTAGDTVLKRLAEVLRAQLRGSDLAARYGGDELVLLLGRIGGPEQAHQVCARLQAAFAREDWLRTLGISEVRADVGIAMLRSADTAESLRSRVEQALIRARGYGPGSIAIAPAVDL
jgi:diguanylate cyclase (GGDEF)-like protein